MFDYEEIIYFDTETTGLKYYTDTITELAYYIETEKNAHDKYISIPDNQHYSTEAIDVTGITREFLKLNGENKETVMTEFYNKIYEKENTLLIAHNISFDVSFIKTEFEKLGLKWKKIDVLDTLTVFKDMAPYPHKLKDAIQYFNIKGVQNSHNAIDDVMALKAVTESMVSINQNVSNYINLIGYNPKYGYDQINLEYCKYLPQKYNSKRPLYYCY
jgi:DNA polymerase-3 subunit epsilon